MKVRRDKTDLKVSVVLDLYFSALAWPMPGENISQTSAVSNVANHS